MTSAPPERLDVGGDGDGRVATYLRWVGVEDAEAIADAVRACLDHLRPWMPWAGPQSADAAFQRERLRNAARLRELRDEWQYGLFAADGDEFLGAFGLMTRRGPGTLEIGYWLHTRAERRGHATAAARALTAAGLDVAGIERMVIACDEANLRSAAVPQRLGYRLARVERRPPEAPGETGRLQLWIRDADGEPDRPPR